MNIYFREVETYHVTYIHTSSKVGKWGLGKGLEKGRGVLGVGFRGKGVFGEGSGRVGKGLGGDVGDGPAEWDRASLIYSYNHTYICIYIYTHINPSSLVFLPIYVFP